MHRHLPPVYDGVQRQVDDILEIKIVVGALFRRYSYTFVSLSS